MRFIKSKVVYNTNQQPHRLVVFYLLFSLLFICRIATVILFDIQRGTMRDVNSRNLDVTELHQVSSLPNSLRDIQRLEMAFVTFSEWE